MELVERHLHQCEICKNDPDLSLELDQLREIIRVPYHPEPMETSFKEEPVYLAEEEVFEEEDEL
ncbi:MAG: hypothetical protein ACK4FM_04090, partial [Caldimicrobium sp.]